MLGPQDIPYVYCVFYFVSPKYLCWLMLSRSGGKCSSYLWNLSSIQYHTLFVACNLGGIVQSSLESLKIVEYTTNINTITGDILRTRLQLTTSLSVKTAMYGVEVYGMAQSDIISACLDCC